MWLFTRYGFYSIVCSRNDDGSVDAGTLLVRGRAEDHMLRLHDHFPALNEFPVLSTPASDYPFRIIVPKKVWAEVVHEMVNEEEWPNFRNEVAAFHAGSGQHYLDAIQDVWDRMAHL